jgi:hypothetical protein
VKIGIWEGYSFPSSVCFKQEASAHARVVAKVHLLEGWTVG